MPTSSSFKKLFPKSFILNKPKDIVSGDFYWIKEIDTKKYIAVADCTGHGVPGGFMSMLGISFLDEIVTSYPDFNAGEILSSIREKIKFALKQENKENQQKDGMDITFCIIDSDKKTIDYAGAYNPLYLLRKTKENFIENLSKNNYRFVNKEDISLFDIKADKQPIAVHIKEHEFNNQKIKYMTGDRIYLFSDGFADQTGGELSKKFLSKHFKELLLNIQSDNITQHGTILEKTISNWQRNTTQVDDILVVGIEL